MANKDTQERQQALRDEVVLQNNLTKSLQEQLDMRTKYGKAQKSIVEAMKGESDAAGKLEEILKAKQKLLEGNYKLSDDQAEKLLEQLETAEELARVEKDREEKQKEIRDLFSETGDKMLGSLGTLGDMVKAGTAFGAVFVLVNKAAELVSEAFENTVGLAKDLYTTTGTTANEAGRLGAQTFAASLSIEGMLYGMEGIANAAKEAGDYFATTRGITGDMQKNIAELTALTGDASSSVELNAIFRDAAGNAKDLTKEIRSIAYNEGVNANIIFKELAENSSLLVGASKEEIVQLVKKTAELQKQGLSMKMMEGISSNMLNIESSIQAEMKARAMGLGEQAEHANAIRAASMQMRFGDAAKGAEMMAQAFKDANITSESLGKMSIAQREATAAMFGMEADELSKMVLQRENFAKLQAEFPNKSAEELAAIEQNRAAMMKFGGQVKQAGVQLGLMVGQYALMNKMQGKGTGIGNLNPFAKSKGPSVETPPIGQETGGGLSGLTGAIEKIDGKKLMAGGAALVLVAASVFVFGKAVQEFMNVSWEAVGMAVVSMLALVGALALVGLIMSGPAGLFILVGAAAMLVMAAALLVLGYAIQEIAVGFEMMGGLTESLMGLIMIAPLLVPLTMILGLLGMGMMALGVGLLLATPGILAFGIASLVLQAAVPAIQAMSLGLSQLVLIAPGLIALAGAFTMLGLSMIPFALGLALITPFIGTLVVLGLMLPLITSALGMGGEEAGAEAAGGGEGDPLLEEIRGLRQDMQSQPIQIVFDNRVISEISRAQRTRQSRGE